MVGTRKKGTAESIIPVMNVGTETKVSGMAHVMVAINKSVEDERQFF